MLRIGFNEGNFHNVYPLYLNDTKIGDVTINKSDIYYTIFDFTLYSEYRGNYYAPKLLHLLENQAKLEGFKFIKLQWILGDKITSLINRGYKIDTIGKEVSVIKEI